MSKYQNGKIYKLSNKINNKYYIGSTCQTLKTRKKGRFLVDGIASDLIMLNQFQNLFGDLLN